MRGSRARRTLALIVAAVAAAVLATLVPSATASHLVYYTGTLSDTQHNPGCFFYLGSACSGWNYWTGSSAAIGNTNGSNFVGLENNSTLRGDEVWGSNVVHSVFASSKGMAGWYLKASISIYTSSYAGIHWAAPCIDPQDCP